MPSTGWGFFFHVAFTTDGSCLYLCFLCSVYLSYISSLYATHFSDLMDILRKTGRQLASGRPGGTDISCRWRYFYPHATHPDRHFSNFLSTELVVGNMVSRILRLVREAYADCARAELSAEEAESVDPILSLHVSQAAAVVEVVSSSQRDTHAITFALPNSTCSRAQSRARSLRAPSSSSRPS